MTSRLPCLVPGCRRTGQGDHPGDDQFICAVHWRPLPPRQRRLYKRLRRRGLELEDARMLRIAARIWHRLRRKAVEAAMGIG